MPSVAQQHRARNDAKRSSLWAPEVGPPRKAYEALSRPTLSIASPKGVENLPRRVRRDARTARARLEVGDEQGREYRGVIYCLEALRQAVRLKRRQTVIMPHGRMRSE